MSVNLPTGSNRNKIEALAAILGNGSQSQKPIGKLSWNFYADLTQSITTAQQWFEKCSDWTPWGKSLHTDLALNGKLRSDLTAILIPERDINNQKIIQFETANNQDKPDLADEILASGFEYARIKGTVRGSLDAFGGDFVSTTGAVPDARLDLNVFVENDTFGTIWQKFVSPMGTNQVIAPFHFTEQTGKQTAYFLFPFDILVPTSFAQGRRTWLYPIIYAQTKNSVESVINLQMEVELVDFVPTQIK
ncbi:hypothetical protein [Vibrio anguillarum]|uniref:hypothetical protein n=1 Tax=Vibrio anguillarum TaxID=55601 RepID=UPI00097E3A34|nr:hypothetical protein [Vibrio anguillarum]AQM20514.1 hypothetical protein PN51_12285 [Vibrio anguillarum]AUB88970.1 hypothetical protein CKY00_17240 [Vibrio anguillarum]AUB92410.1 hypothetical protein CKX99_17255 [Vibrio anguillarum]AUB95845.1 hypothetical protein CK210_17240 [Vibrio anguillarum]AUB99266.1 hypothetical protein CK209_17170 [Vibrio anguillarum]